MSCRSCVSCGSTKGNGICRLMEKCHARDGFKAVGRFQDLVVLLGAGNHEHDLAECTLELLVAKRVHPNLDHDIWCESTLLAAAKWWEK